MFYIFQPSFLLTMLDTNQSRWSKQSIDWLYWFCLVIFSTIFFFTVNRQCRQCSEWRRLESQQFLQMTFWESQQSQLHHLPQDWNSYKSWGSDSKLHLLVHWKLSVKYKFNCRGLWSWSTNLFLFQLRVGCCLLVTLFTSLTESNDWTTCWHFTHFISCCQ